MFQSSVFSAITITVIHVAKAARGLFSRRGTARSPASASSAGISPSLYATPARTAASPALQIRRPPARARRRRPGLVIDMTLISGVRLPGSASRDPHDLRDGSTEPGAPMSLEGPGVRFHG